MVVRRNNNNSRCNIIIESSRFSYFRIKKARIHFSLSLRLPVCLIICALFARSVISVCISITAKKKKPPRFELGTTGFAILCSTTVDEERIILNERNKRMRRYLSYDFWTTFTRNPKRLFLFLNPIWGEN